MTISIRAFLTFGLQKRVAANMFCYDDFKVTTHKVTIKSGSKGGQNKTRNTTYIYSALLMLGLCKTNWKILILFGGIRTRLGNMKDVLLKTPKPIYKKQ